MYYNEMSTELVNKLATNKNKIWLKAFLWNNTHRLSQTSEKTMEELHWIFKL